MTAVEIAKHYLGSRTGSAAVAKFLTGVGLKPPAAWCAAFCVFVTYQANPHSHLPKTGRCSLLLALAEANPLRFKVITPGDVDWGIDRPMSGDIEIFAHNPGVTDFLGHAEIVDQDLGHGHTLNVGGNTTCGHEPGSERMGNCVAMKHRSIGVRGLMAQGLIRER